MVKLSIEKDRRPLLKQQGYTYPPVHGLKIFLKKNGIKPAKSIDRVVI